jgi:stalled ribosome rescue protein Dom34
MSRYHAVVWFTSTEQTSTVIHAHGQHQSVHSRKSTHGGYKSPADEHFFEAVAHALEGGVHEILVIGPAQTKQEFVDYLRHKHPPLGRAVVAVENADHPRSPTTSDRYL